MHSSPDQTYFLLVAMSVIYVAERIWTLTSKIITFFDKRSVANRKPLKGKGTNCLPPKGRAKLPIAVGGPLPRNQNSSRRTAPPATNAALLAQIAAGTLALPSRSILARNAAASAGVKP